MKGAAVAAVAVLVCGVIVFVLVQSGVKPASAHCTGTPHECLHGVEMTDTAGATWNTASLDGKVVLVNFWATWCKPCVAEIPLLTRYHEQHRDQGFVLLGVMTDQVNDAQLAHFTDGTGLRYPVVRANETLLRAFDYPEALPTTFLYARDGTLVDRHIGPLSARWLDDRLPALLEQR